MAKVIKKVEKKEGKPAFAKATAGKYFEAVGRRKTSIARVRLYPHLKDKEILVNEKEYTSYFSTKEQQDKITKPFLGLNIEHPKITVKVKGGGIMSQAEAVRHGVSRALLLIDPTYRKRLRALGFLTRDSRMKERRKYGLKKARKAPQWQKR